MNAGVSKDCCEHAFGDCGPWQIDPAELTWTAGLDGLRESLRGEVARLLKPRTLPPFHRFFSTALHLGGALLFWYGGARKKGGANSRADLSHRLRTAFERLGPSYIKLGQILSSGRGLFPDEVVDEFKLLRDSVKPEPFEHVRQVIREDFGEPIEALFSSFEQDCLAAASIAQVHAATLRTGERVVVKVQRPSVARLVQRDIRAMAWIAPYLVGRIPIAALANPPALVELFAETVLEELDFRLEAENMLDLARIFAAAGQRVVIVPRPHPRLVTRRVLVMEQLSGFKYENVDAIRAARIDTSAMLRSLMISFLEGAIIYGIFHGDLHGGNLFVTPEGKIALFDYGITARMNETERLAFLRLMMLGMVNDVRGQLVAYRDLGALAPNADLDAVIRDLKLDEPIIDPTTLSGDDLTKEIQRVIRALLAYGAKLPKPLMLFVKNMLFLDDAIAHLAPDVNLFEEVLQIYGYFVQHHAEKIAAESGVDPASARVDLTGFKASLGMTADADRVTHRDLLRRRAIIRERLEQAGERK